MPSVADAFTISVPLYVKGTNMILLLVLESGLRLRLATFNLNTLIIT
jgi:hypothetical protein